jgi:hypothetical protein
MRAISTAIRSAHDVGIEIGICGQAPSDHPKFTQVLVGKIVNLIPLHPNKAIKTSQFIADSEATRPGPAKPGPTKPGPTKPGPASLQTFRPRATANSNGSVPGLLRSGSRVPRERGAFVRRE